MHRLFEQGVGQRPDFVGNRPMGPPDLTDGVSHAFVDVMKGCVNGVAIIFDSSLFPSVPFFLHPSLELVGERSGVRSKNDAHAQTDFGSDAFRHRQGVAVGFLVAQKGIGRCGKIRTVNQDEVCPSCPLKGACCFKKQAFPIEVEMVVEHRAIVDHAVPSNSLYEKASLCKHRFPIHGGHGDHVGMTGVRDDALPVWPKLDGE